MPSVTPQRRAHEESRDDSIGGSFAIAPNSHSSKRARLGSNRGLSPSQSPQPSVHHRSLRNGEQRRVAPTGKSIQTEYQPGSIVRVKLANFVTYTAVEFFPGPTLNMVIGPNGTGKSTLVCAICLGLGWGPQHLGRAKEVSEFVKHGSQEAMIEIELAGHPHEQNPVIRTNIKREGSKCSYFINHSPSNKKRVMELAKSYSIQIDNLCQFLPQDKVVEFAAMTPVELLRSTQRAVASEEMLEWHEELKTLRHNQRTLHATKTHDTEQLANLEKRHKGQEADVEKLRMREQVKKQLEMLRDCRPFAEYRAAITRYHGAKDQRKEASKQLQELKDAVEPTLRAVNSKQVYQEKLKRYVDERAKLVTKADQKAASEVSKIDNIQGRLDDLDRQVTAEANSNKTNKAESARLEGVIRGLKKQLEEKPVDFDVGALNVHIREKEKEGSALGDQAKELLQAMADLESRGKDRNNRILAAERELNNLASQAGQQTKKLKEMNRETALAWEWVQEHQDQFEKRVYGPPMVECSVKDPKYLDVVEASFSRTDFTCFTVQTRSDFNKLDHQLKKVMNLCDVNIRTMPAGLADFRAPVGREELARYGLDGWTLDFLNGPETVLAMLCSDGPRLYCTGVSLQDTTPQQFEALQNSPIGTWVTRKSLYAVKRRREYGPGAVSTQVRDVQSAKIWTNQPVDVAATRELKANIAEWREEVLAFLREIEEKRAEVRMLKEKNGSIEKEKRELIAEKEVKQKAIKAFNALPTRLAGEEKKLEGLQSSMNGVRDRVMVLLEQINEATLQKGQAALNYARALGVLCETHDDLYEAELMYIEAKSDFEVLTERNGSIKQRLETKGREVQEIEKISDQAAKLARKILDKCRAILAKADEDPELKAFQGSLPTGQSLEEFDAVIEQEEAKLGFMVEGNHGIIKEYERRQRDIDSLKASLAVVDEGLEELRSKIEELQGKWEPQLDNLVKRISNSFTYNMKQINCAGEVSVYKDEDFDLWAIQIQVKFRENEELSILDSHRQSGGERAVSTIFYLMSLQSLTRSPFRVVDEINQGMDPRNERLVHARMVSIATGNDEQQFADDGDDGEEEVTGGGGSQYFLITPKLLHGLRYERGMRVLCIASGEYMPKDQTRVDFKHCVDIMKGLALRSRAIGVEG